MPKQIVSSSDNMAVIDSEDTTLEVMEAAVPHVAGGRPQLHARSSATVACDIDKEDGPTPAPNSYLSRQNVEQLQKFRSGVESWLDKFALAVSLLAWYTIGILAIVTTKLLIQDWNVPPLVLTVQQLVLGTIILRLVLGARDGQAHPWPWQTAGRSGSSSTAVLTSSTVASPNGVSASSTSTSSALVGDCGLEQNELTMDKLKRWLPWLAHPNFVMVGIFNSLDFLCSNTAFSFSSAHFVETIKASDPITTTAVALAYKVDKLGFTEACSLAMLVAGVLMSTWGNSTEDSDNGAVGASSTSRRLASSVDDGKLLESVQTAALATLANVCFAYRAMNQKKYRSITNETQQMDDVNLLCRLCHVGAVFLMVPMLILYGPSQLQIALDAPSDTQFAYVGLSLVNAFSYVTYNFSSCYVLSKLTVLHHSSLNCLRRMVAIVATSMYFGKPMSFEAVAGLSTSFFGFASFTYHRNKRMQHAKTKDSNV